MLNQIFSQDVFLIRKKVLRFIGASFHIYNQKGELQLFVNQKGFKLKEDIKIYTGIDKSQEVIFIQARNIIDISATYDVFDSYSKERIGSLKRKGLKSIIKDEWLIIDANELVIGNIKEENMLLALLRRTLTSLIPQTFIGTVNSIEVFKFVQKFNPFIQKITLDFTMDSNKLLDRRLGIAAGILLCAIEGKQS